MHNKTLILITMQLRDLLELDWLKSKRKTLFKTVFAVLGIGVFTAIVALVLQSLYTLTGILVSKNILTFVLSVLLILSLVSCTNGLNKSLYRSSDNILLLSFPTQPNQVYLSKLVVFYLYELKRNLGFFFSFFIGYGIFSKAGAIYYVAIIIVYLLTILLPVLIGALISIPLMLIKHFIDSHNFLKIGLYILIFIGVYYVGFYLSQYLPTEFRLVAEWGAIYTKIIAITDVVAMNSLFVKNIIDLLVFSDILTNFSIMMGVVIILLALAYIISRPLYFRLASRPLEIRQAKLRDHYDNHVINNSFFGFLKKETLILVRTPERFFSEYIFLIMAPMIVFYFTKVISAMPLAGLGFAMQKAFTIFMVLIVMTASNTISSIAISSEGKAFYYSKTMPLSFSSQVWAKITINMVVNVIAIFVCCYIIQTYTQTLLYETIYIFFILCLICIGHIFWAIEIDIRFPKVHQYAANEQNIDTTNGSKTIFVGLITGIIFTAGILKNLTERLDTTWIKMLLLAAAFFIARLYMLISVEKVLYEEIE